MYLSKLNLKVTRKSLKNPDGTYNGALVTTLIAGLLVVILNVCNMLNVKFPVDIRSLVDVINSIASLLAVAGIMSYGHISDDNGTPKADVPVVPDTPKVETEVPVVPVVPVVPDTPKAETDIPVVPDTPKAETETTTTTTIFIK